MVRLGGALGGEGGGRRRAAKNKSASGRISKGTIPSRTPNDDCRSALQPAFLIAAIWCLGMYCRLWMSLYQSLHGAVDDATVGGHFAVSDRRKDLLAIRLRQFLISGGGSSSGSSSENFTVETTDDAEDGRIDDHASPRSSHRVENATLEKLGNPIIAKQVRALLISRTGYPNLVLGAYLEPPLLLEESNNGESFMKLRVHAPRNLTYISYPPYRRSLDDRVGIMDKPACSRNGAQWIFPTSHPKSLDHHFGGNVFRRRPNFDKRWELAGIGNDDDDNHTRAEGYCPVDADPYLPWIHDAFPSDDGGHVEFVISNKRRCNTNPKRFGPDMKNLEPQVALMQPVPVKRIGEGRSEFGVALSSLWSHTADGREDATIGSEAFVLDDGSYIPPRYALATSLDDADEDARYTRFICRFHTLEIDDEVDGGSDGPRLRKVVLGETLSTYTYNPEHANYRKQGSKPMLLNAHDEQIWNSVYNARCPVPRDGVDALPEIIASGRSVVDGAPSLYLDLIPIRTPVRKDREGFGLPGKTNGSFDPERAWGDAHVLPRVEASGRWANIPVCRPPMVDEGSVVDPSELALEASRQNDVVTPRSKKHFLVACVWASHSFSTRGQTNDSDSSTGARLREFLSYHLQLAGFDHVYVYDNSDTTASNDTLAAVTELFSRRLVTTIPWPHRVCNNNRPADANPGERSSQYAAESSCRARYGPGTTWMATLDVDEYLIPTGERWKTLRHWLEHVSSNEVDTKILSFYQTRALPNIDLMIPYEGGSAALCKVEKNVSTLNSMCVMKDPNKSYLATYNCEPTTHPKPNWAWRAKKQVYRPDFVLNHFVHYSLVTRRILDKPEDASDPRFVERAPFERRVNELTEVFLLHAKTTGPEKTSGWNEVCHRKGDDITRSSTCTVGIPSHEIMLGEYNLSVGEDGNAISAAFESNCYRHSRVMKDYVPRLESALHAFNPV